MSIEIGRGTSDFNFDPEEEAFRCGEDAVRPELYGMYDMCWAGSAEDKSFDGLHAVGYGLVEEEQGIPLTAEEDDATIHEGDACLTRPLRAVPLNPIQRTTSLTK